MENVRQDIHRFRQLPGSARIWIYLASRQLNEQEQSAILSSLEDFFSTWESHGRQVSGEALVHADRFLIIGAHVPGGDISGCGIDASAHAADIALELHGVKWLDNLNVAFRRPDDNGIEVLSRPDFRLKVQAGEITPETLVFDMTISTVNDYHEGLLEKPIKNSWHSASFEIKELTTD